MEKTTTLQNGGISVSTFVKKEFSEPSVEYATAYCWSWDGTVTEEGIRHRMLDLREGGIRCLYVLPMPPEFRPITMTANRMQPSYMSEAYLSLIHYFFRTAEELGMGVWLYDEAGWPSGSVCTQIVQRRPDLRSQVITPITLRFPQGMTYTPPTHHKNFLAAFRKGTDGKFCRITAPAVYDGSAEFIEYRCMAAYNTGTFNNDYNTDILRPDTARLFLELTHEKYKQELGSRFGGQAPYIFNDEPKTEDYAWTPDLAQRFAEAYGYDVLDYLPILRRQASAVTDAEKQAWTDYHQLVCRLAMERFFRPVRDWCRDNGIGFIGHLDNEHNAEVLVRRNCYAMPLEVMRLYDVPGVDTIYRHIYPEGCGFPAVHQPIAPFFPRFASSAAAQNGGGLALTESMAVYSEGFSPDILRYVMGAQTVRGINVLNINSVEYANPLIRPGFRPERPWFSHMLQINRYLERLAYLNRLGRRDCSAALYLPQEDILRGGSADPFHRLGRELEARHIDFDVIDDAFVRECAAEGGCLRMGLAAYTSVFIPGGATLPVDVAEKLRGYIVTDTAPVAVCDDPHIRLARRVTDDGALYFAFNESKDTRTVTLSLSEERPVYRLYAEDGRVERWQEGSLTLCMGETVVLYVTDTPLDAEEPAQIAQTLTLTAPYTVEKVKEFTVDPTGARLDAVTDTPRAIAAGGWKTVLGEEFSGVAVYRTTFDLTDEFLQGDVYLLDLGEVEYSACVTVNGHQAGIASLSPHRVRIPRAVLSAHNELAVEVANTASNRIVEADVSSWHHQSVVGPYHPIISVYEREYLGGGLHGPVTLSRLK